jgi:cytochrome c-type biogenesis protein CcmH
MSPRDTYWYLAGTATGLLAGALGIYLLLGKSTHPTPTNTSNLLMPGDSWPSLADASAAGADPNGPAISAESAAATKGANAGALDEVTRSLAERLATKGGTDDEWRLLAQSYDYMGRTEEARAARTHVAATEGSRISGTVQISADLAAHAAPGTTLFIYATDGTTPGPPLAVLRLRVDRWPVSFVLDDADAMIPGRNLSASKSVQLEARVSPSGEALPRPGDLVGNLANVDPHTTHAVNISIDHKIG